MLFISYENESSRLDENLPVRSQFYSDHRVHFSTYGYQTCQPSRFWRDSPAFLPDVPRPAKSWKCPAFCTKSDLFAQICNAAAVQITQIERNYGNSVRFLAKIPNGTAAESPCYSVFWNAIDFCRLYTSKKSQCGPCQPSRFLPASPAFLREMSL